MSTTKSNQQGWVAVTLAVILVIVLAVVAYFYQQYRSQLAQAQDNVSALEQAQERAQSELTTVQSRLSDANSRVRELETERSRLLSDAEATSERLAALQARYDDLRQDSQSSVGDLQSELEQARQDRDELQQTLAEADGLIARQAEQQVNLEAELQETIETLAAVEAELVAAEAHLADTTDELAATTAELEAERAGAADLNRQLDASQAHVQRLLNERTALLASTQRMEQENRQQQAANDRLQQQLDETLAELNIAEVELMRREANLDQAVAERETVVDEYRQAREELALQQARSENYSETIAELEARLNRETQAMDELQSQLQSLSNERQTLVSRLEDGTTVIKLPENIVFASGSASIGEAGRETLQLLADALVSFPDHLISIQGHSDGRPISPSLQEKYPSNWELSTARAASAVQVLNQSGIDSDRMQAVGYADTRPLVEETDEQSRRANRRIEVLLYPNQFTMRVLDQAGLETP